MSYKKLNPSQLKFVKWLDTAPDVWFSISTSNRINRMLLSGGYHPKNDADVFNQLGTLHSSKYKESLGPKKSLNDEQRKFLIWILDVHNIFISRWTLDIVDTVLRLSRYSKSSADVFNRVMLLHSKAYIKYQKLNQIK